MIIKHNRVITGKEKGQKVMQIFSTWHWILIGSGTYITVTHWNRPFSVKIIYRNDQKVVTMLEWTPLKTTTYRGPIILYNGCHGNQFLPPSTYKSLKNTLIILFRQCTWCHKKVYKFHCPMKVFWRPSLRPFRQNNVGISKNWDS